MGTDIAHSKRCPTFLEERMKTTAFVADEAGKIRKRYDFSLRIFLGQFEIRDRSFAVI